MQVHTEVIYVALDGNDAWSGQLLQPNSAGTDGPLRSLQLAADRAGKDGVVAIAAGSYYEVGVELGAEHSGLTIQAAPGGRPQLFGGRRIGGWQRQGDWLVAPLPADGSWNFRLLTVNGEYRQRARLPHKGRFRHLSKFDVSWMGTDAGGWKRKPTETELTTLRFASEDLDSRISAKNAEIQVFHLWDDSIVDVATIDHEQQIITFASATGHPPGSFPWAADTDTYFVWNVAQGMCEPGMWYLDKEHSQVVYWPKPGETLDSLDVVAPTVESIFRIHGAANICIQGLELAVTNAPVGSAGFGAFKLSGAIHATESEGLGLSGLTVHHTGGQGLHIVGGECHQIADSRIYDTGAGGIRMASCQSAVIQNNFIYHCGLDYPASIALAASGEDIAVLDNEIAYAPYTGISSSGKGTRIERNLVRSVMQELDDGGGIYITFIQDAVVRHNVVMNIDGRQSHAYYLDELAKYCLVEKNIAAGTASALLHHIARGNRIRNNVFIHREGELKFSFLRSMDEVFERNIVYAGKGIIVSNREGIQRMESNLFFSQSGELVQRKMDQYEEVVQEPLQREGDSTEDPQFAAFPSLLPESPALRMGVEPIQAKDFHEEAIKWLSSI